MLKSDCDFHNKFFFFPFYPLTLFLPEPLSPTKPCPPPLPGSLHNVDSGYNCSFGQWSTRPPSREDEYLVGHVSRIPFFSTYGSFLFFCHWRRQDSDVESSQTLIDLLESRRWKRNSSCVGPSDRPGTSYSLGTSSRLVQVGVSQLVTGRVGLSFINGDI